jgi:hypothetical protein
MGSDAETVLASAFASLHYTPDFHPTIRAHILEVVKVRHSVAHILLDFSVLSTNMSRPLLSNAGAPVLEHNSQNLLSQPNHVYFAAGLPRSEAQTKAVYVPRWRVRYPYTHSQQLMLCPSLAVQHNNSLLHPTDNLLTPPCLTAPLPPGPPTSCASKAPSPSFSK